MTELSGLSSGRMEEGSHVDPVNKKDGVREMVDECGGGASLTSQCGVCGAPASEHRHYGAVSCYSCRLAIVLLLE